MNVAVTRLLIVAYGLMLCGVGLAGIVIARWELTQIFAVELGRMDGAAQATLLNQYRFLKAIELGAGIGCLLFLRSIIAGEPAARWFVALVAAGAVARILAWMVDGRPHWAFLAFLALELLVFIATLLHLRRAAHG